MKVSIKTKEDIEKMRIGGKILAEILSELKEFAKEGIRLIEIENEAKRLIQKNKVKSAFLGYDGYGFVTCLNVNEIVQHGIPTEKILQNSDIISIDSGIIYEDMYLDSTVCKVIGKLSSSSVEMRLQACASEVMNKVIAILKPEILLSEIIKTIEYTIKSHKFNPILDFIGHGVGYELHEEPDIPNYWLKHMPDLKIRSGMTFAIEPMISSGSGNTKSIGKLGLNATTVDKSKCVSFENTILITENGCEVLTHL